MGDRVNKSIALKGFTLPLLLVLPFMPVSIHTIRSLEQLAVSAALNMLALYFLTLDADVRRLFRNNPRPKNLSRSVFGLLLVRRGHTKAYKPGGDLRLCVIRGATLRSVCRPVNRLDKQRHQGRGRVLRARQTG